MGQKRQIGKLYYIKETETAISSLKLSSSLLYFFFNFLKNRFYIDMLFFPPILLKTEIGVFAYSYKKIVKNVIQSCSLLFFKKKNTTECGSLILTILHIHTVLPADSDADYFWNSNSFLIFKLKVSRSNFFFNFRISGI
jgi:hypothetical protein